MSDPACSNVEILDKIGQGTYGKVFRAKIEGENVVVKRIDYRPGKIMMDASTLYDLVFTKMLDNENIISMKEFCHRDGFDELYLEEMDYDLRKWIKTTPFYIRRNNINYFIEDMASALYELYKNYLVHNDIKPDNILVQHIGKDKYIFKLADFGFTTPVLQLENTRFFGTRVYTAPEGLVPVKPVNEDYSKIDIWSLGLTIHDIVFKGMLYSGSTNEEILESIAKNMYSPEDTNDFIDNVIKQSVISDIDLDMDKLVADGSLEKNTVQLVKRMTKINVSDRISVPELYNYIFKTQPVARKVKSQIYDNYMPLIQYLAYNNVSGIPERITSIYIMEKLYKMGLHDKYYDIVPHIASLFWRKTTTNFRKYTLRVISDKHYVDDLYEVLELIDYDIYKPFIEIVAREFKETFALIEFSSIPYNMVTDFTFPQFYNYYTAAEKFHLPRWIIHRTINIVESLDSNLGIQINRIFFILTCINRIPYEVINVQYLDLCVSLSKYILDANVEPMDMTQQINRNFVDNLGELLHSTNFAIDYLSPTFAMKVLFIRQSDYRDIIRKLKTFLIEPDFTILDLNMYEIFTHVAYDYINRDTLRKWHTNLYNNIIIN